MVITLTGESYTTSILFPVIAFGIPLSLFMMVALGKLWCKTPNVGVGGCVCVGVAIVVVVLERVFVCHV